ncbi:BglG family transcription antiterminator [Pantoea ananatis]|uniref:BglG family transcription antiterminator n=1 Tax=Pantoea ananas TaxID=553 RepID=UPI001D03CD01|nr:PRD domain-containing protein [Pantoea ananatis]
MNYATTLITRLSSLLRQNIGSDSVLLNALVSHVKPMLNRLAYRIVIHNPLLDEIRKEFAAVFNVVKQAVLHLNQQWGLPTASDDEIAYLTIYIQNALEKCHATKRVMLVCSSGIGTSQLLSSRISRAFPEWEIVDIVPGARLNEAIKKVRCDLIISTIRLEETEHPVAYVSALFSNRDVLRVMECLNKEDNANGVTDA